MTPSGAGEASAAGGRSTRVATVVVVTTRASRRVNDTAVLDTAVLDTAVLDEGTAVPASPSSSLGVETCGLEADEAARSEPRVATVVDVDARFEGRGATKMARGAIRRGRGMSADDVDMDGRAYRRRE